MEGTCQVNAAIHESINQSINQMKW